MPTSKKAVAALTRDRVSSARKAGNSLGDVLVSIETGLGLHGEDLGHIRRVVDGISESIDGEQGIKATMATKADIEALTDLVREGFASLGINIANGDHRIGRPVR